MQFHTGCVKVLSGLYPDLPHLLFQGLGLASVRGGEDIFDELSLHHPLNRKELSRKKPSQVSGWRIPRGPLEIPSDHS